MRERFLQGIYGRRSTAAQENQPLAGAITSVEVWRVEHLDQGCYWSILAPPHSHGGSVAHDRRPIAKALEELFVSQRIIEAIAIFVVPSTPVEDE